MSKAKCNTIEKQKRRYLVHSFHNVKTDDISEACGFLKEERQLFCDEIMQTSLTLDFGFKSEVDITLGDILDFLRPRRTYIWKNQIFSVEPIKYTFYVEKE